MADDDARPVPVRPPDLVDGLDERLVEMIAQSREQGVRLRAALLQAVADLDR